jgi:hypothetical protein
VCLFLPALVKQLHAAAAATLGDGAASKVLNAAAAAAPA